MMPIHKAKQPPLTPNEKTIIKFVDAHFESQLAEALRRIGKDDFDPGWLNDLVWSEKLVDVTSPALAKELALGYGVGGEKLSAYLPSDLAEEYISTWVENEAASQFIRETTFDFAKAVNDTTHDKFRDAMLKAEEAGETIPERKKRISSLFKGFDEGNRAERIARTETLNALHEGSTRQWKDSGVVTGKIWDAAGDACPFCTFMDGKRVGIDDVFYSKGDVLEVDVPGRDTPARLNLNYRDTKHPPIHTMCRCDIEPELIPLSELR